MDPELPLMPLAIAAKAQKISEVSILKQPPNNGPNQSTVYQTWVPQRYMNEPADTAVVA